MLGLTQLNEFNVSMKPVTASKNDAAFECTDDL